MSAPNTLLTDDVYRTYLAEVDKLALTDPAPDIAAGKRLQFIAMLVEKHEKICFPFDGPKPGQSNWHLQ